MQGGTGGRAGGGTGIPHQGSRRIFERSAAVLSRWPLDAGGLADRGREVGSSGADSWTGSASVAAWRGPGKGAALNAGGGASRGNGAVVAAAADAEGEEVGEWREKMSVLGMLDTGSPITRACYTVYTQLVITS